MSAESLGVAGVRAGAGNRGAVDIGAAVATVAIMAMFLFMAWSAITQVTSMFSKPPIAIRIELRDGTLMNCMLSNGRVVDCK